MSMNCKLSQRNCLSSSVPRLGLTAELRTVLSRVKKRWCGATSQVTGSPGSVICYLLVACTRAKYWKPKNFSTARPSNTRDARVFGD